MNLATLLQPGQQQFPDAIAVSQGAVHLTYRQLARDADHIARHLQASGIAPGQVVGVDLQRPISHWLTLLALMRLGAVTLSLTGARAAEVAELPALAAVIRAEGDDTPCPDTLCCITLGKDWLRLPAPDAPLPPPDLAARLTGRIVFTSGTAGRPKGFLLDADRLLARLSGTAARTLITTRSVLWCGLGPDTAYGFTATLAAWAAGAQVVLARGGSGDFRALSARHVNLILASPAALAALLRDAVTTDLPPLSATAIVAGGRLPPAQRDALLARACTRVLVAYGASESGGIAMGDAQALNDHPGHVGTLYPDVACRIVDDAGRDLPPDTPGRLMTRTPSTATAYMNLPEATARHFADGWFIPGDTARLSAGRVLTLLGRPADTLNLGGVKLPADEIDTAARAEPGVQDAAAVVLNAQGAARLALVIVGEPADPLALTAALRARFPALPRLTLLALPALPRGTMGKLNRQALAEQIDTGTTAPRLLGEF